MKSPEGIDFENSTEPAPDEVEKEDPTFEEENTDHFIKFLYDEPSVPEMLEKIRSRYAELEKVTKGSFDAKLDSVRPYQRIREIESFAGRTALDYISLHKNISDMMDLADHISDEDREEILRESQKTATYYEGHTLLRYYANRGNLEKKKSIDSPTRNTENAALQQSMAKYYLRHQEELSEFEEKLDAYGKRTFGRAEYGVFKRGVVSLADAHQHLEAHGYHVFFPPPRMDAEDRIDLICVDESIPDEYAEQAKDFFQDDFSKEDLVRLPSEILEYVNVAQVKTSHNLRRMYGTVGTEDVSLENLVNKYSLDRRYFDGVDDAVFENTSIFGSNVESVIAENSRATVFRCNPIADRSYEFSGVVRHDLNLGGMDPDVRKIRDDIQDLGTFIGETPNVGSIYIFVEVDTDDRDRKGFY